MRKTHIVGIVIIALAIGAIVVSVGDTSSYVNFSKAESNPNTQYHVVGQLDKDKPLNYNPRKDPNHFSFHLRDEAGKVRKVVYQDAKPNDFERSEQVVIVGEMGDDEVFHASKILMKCPSKYKEKELDVNSKEVAKN